MAKTKLEGPKVLFLDIETAPIVAYVWSLWDQNVGLNQIKSDWHLLSWSAKWLGAPDVLYQDQRTSKKIDDDTKLLKGIWKLIDEADIIVTQNGKAFDEKKLNARFILAGLKPPSPYRHIDTKQIAKRVFGFTSNKLEYMADKINTKYKKQKHAKFSGFDLWKECLAGNVQAWNEMEKYNKYDVLALEELYLKMQPWDNTLKRGLYTVSPSIVCDCGSHNLQRRGYATTTTGKYARLQCQDCGTWRRGSVNLLSKEKRQSILRKT